MDHGERGGACRVAGACVPCPCDAGQLLADVLVLLVCHHAQALAQEGVHALNARIPCGVVAPRAHVLDAELGFETGHDVADEFLGVVGVELLRDAVHEADVSHDGVCHALRLARREEDGDVVARH